ncbi:3706_t:CDS:10 [Funneliformis caledonium]|uniref:3706_t:CDS:1 n=1 Tax=Funneliformis caledonium TaxID=1117310 RepID=A0A9N9AWR4_9GLOM|nr:3706_t:CDS:10 [Funneliformis caledonium]
MSVRQVASQPTNPLLQEPSRISTRYASVPTQRLIATAVFVAIWAYKLYYFTTGLEHFSLFGVLFQWCLIDTMFFITLYFCRIPWLHFPLWKIILLLILSCIINSFFIYPRWVYDAGITKSIIDVFGSSSMLIRQQFLKLRGEKVRAVSMEEDIQIEVVRHNSSHIKGKHTVRLLPYATAKLNPDDDRYCLKRTDSKKSIPVVLPILFNKTSPQLIHYSRVDFESGNKTIHEFSSKEISRHRLVDLIQDGVFVYIPVTEPGVYKIEQALDADGMGIKIYRKEEILVYCPEARLISITDKNCCMNDEIYTKLVLKGVPPLSVYYERCIGDESVNMTIDGIGAEHLKFPIAEPDRAKLFSASGNYQWARDQIITVQLNMTADTPATYSLKVLEVNDLLNNTYNYIDEQNLDVFVKYDAFIRPTAKFLSDAPLFIPPGYNAEMKLNLQGVAPWKLDVGYWSEDIAEMTDILSSEPTEILNMTIRESKMGYSISVNKPGTYKLLSVSDAKCSGQILAPSTNTLSIAYPPTVKIDAIPISAEDCPGEIGIEATLSFTGIPRWVLEFSIKSEVETKEEVVMSEKSKRTITVKPPMPGHYEYRFFSLADYIYSEGVDIDYRFTQTVHPKPNAVFRRVKDRIINSCMGNLVELDVVLSGTGPFTLEYEVVFNRRTNAFTIADIQGPSYVIISPPFENPGTYTVTLKKVTDSKGCSQVLDNDDFVTINVKRDKPTVGFRNAHEILGFLEGESVGLPLQLTGNPRWEVTYIYHEDVDNVRKAYSLVNPNSYLTVTEPGRYELLEVKDSYCIGKVITEKKEIEVRWLPKPSLRIAEGDAEPLPQPGYFERNSICAGKEDTLGLVLEGRAPWIISYSIVSTSLNTAHQQTIGFPSTRIRLMTENPGIHAYNFSTIADDIYTEPNEMLLILVQTVLPNPNARFANTGTVYHCVGTAFTKDDSIMIELDGVPPFSLLFEVMHESSNHVETLRMESINNTLYYFQPREKFSLVGQYIISIVYVSDSQGCSSSLEGPDKKLIVQVTDVASIDRTFHHQFHCVGDLLDYSLQGIPPWNITYEYNGEVKFATSKAATFTFGADKPGNMTIVNVCHQRNKCCGSVTNLTEIIYDLPSAFLSEGKEVISDIREGDKTEIIIDFLGEPPFRFTYTRRELLKDGNKRKPGRIIETQTILNVNKHQHSIYTSLEGIFQVTYVGDRYCEYPRSSDIK